MKNTRFSLVIRIVTCFWCQTIAFSSTAWVQTHSQADSSVLLRQESSCFYYTVNKSGSADLSFKELEGVVRKSFATWQNVDCSYFYFMETDPSEIDDAVFHTTRANNNLLVWREKQTEWPFTKAAVAMTTLQHDPKTGRIYDTDIEFNGAWYEFAAQPSYPGRVSVTDLENTLTHEIGHTVGLDHTDVSDATMYADAVAGEIKKRTLADDDIEGLCSIYPLENDPAECLEPYCGLALDNDDDTCNGVGTGGGGDDDGDCSCVATGRHTGKPPAVLDFLWRISVHSEV